MKYQTHDAGGGRSRVRRVTRIETKPTRCEGSESAPQIVAVVGAAGGGVQFHLLHGTSPTAALTAFKAELATGDHHKATIGASLFQQLASRIGQPDGHGACEPCGSKRYVAFTVTAGCMLQLLRVRALNAALAASIVKEFFPADHYLCSVELADFILVANAFAAADGPRVVHLQPSNLN